MGMWLLDKTALECEPCLQHPCSDFTVGTIEDMIPNMLTYKSDSHLRTGSSPLLTSFSWQNIVQRRKLDLTKLDNAGFQKLVTLVAASGFLIDGYLLFANNFALPIIGFLYWRDGTSPARGTGINCATLAGTIIGQITFGIWADWKGRKIVYGYELLTVFIGSILIAIASPGLVQPGDPAGDGSMSIVALLVIFRFIIGLGVGAEYPITAAITSEWAPADHRGRMLAFVFSSQALGSCLAALVTFLALAGRHMSLDAVWRLLYGLPAIPALFAYYIRRTIPETPRYIYDVQRDAVKASDGVRYMTSEAPAEDPEAQNLVDPSNELPPEQSRGDFEDYFFHPEGKWHSYDGNEVWNWGSWTAFRFTGKWTRLLGTCVAWFLLDFSFFGLGLNSPQIVTGLWKGCRIGNTPNALSAVAYWNSEPGIATDPRRLFKENALAFLSMVSSGTLLGSLTLILVARFVDRRKVMWISFLILGIFFFILGILLWREILVHYSASYIIVILLYVACQFLFNFGPNALTFIIPAEIFPTRYRCTCLGISAASGKFGSILAEAILYKLQFNALDYCAKGIADTTLGKVLVGFGFTMLLGALVSYFLPSVQYGEDKKNETLEHLGRGPPPRPPPAADPEQGPQQPQQHHLAPAPQQPQQTTGLQPRHPHRRQNDPSPIGDQPQPSYGAPLPPLPLNLPEPSLLTSNPVPPPHLRRKRVNAPTRKQYSEDIEMEEPYQPGPSRRQGHQARASTESQSWLNTR